MEGFRFYRSWTNRHLNRGLRFQGVGASGHGRLRFERGDWKKKRQRADLITEPPHMHSSELLTFPYLSSILRRTKSKRLQVTYLAARISTIPTLGMNALASEARRHESGSWSIGSRFLKVPCNPYVEIAWNKPWSLCKGRLVKPSCFQDRNTGMPRKKGL